MPAGAERSRRRHRVLAIAGVLLLPLVVVCALSWSATRKSGPEREQAQASYLAEEGAAAAPRAAVRNRFGIEGPQYDEEAPMAREEVHEQAANSGIIDVLRGIRVIQGHPQPAQQGPGFVEEETPDWLLAEDAKKREPARTAQAPLAQLGGLLNGRVGSAMGLGGKGAGAQGAMGTAKRTSMARRNSAQRAGGGGEGGAAREPLAGTDERNGDASVREHSHADKREATTLPQGTTKAAQEEDGLTAVTVGAEASVVRVGRGMVARTARGQGERDSRSDRTGDGYGYGRAKLAMMAALPVSAPAASGDLLPATALLERYASLEDVRVQEARGYWENTYVPGDPKLRTLQARLDAYAPSALAPMGLEGDPSLQAHRPAQPFDAPEHAALGVHLSASERGVTGRTRMQLQVGLQATSRFGGQRPAMNVGLVLDLREPLDGPTAATLRALLESFARARDLGDRFSLVVAGKPGGLLLTPDEFRHGPLTVALQTLLAKSDGGEGRGAPQRVPSIPDTTRERTRTHRGETLDLQAAAQIAADAVRGDDDPSAPLGSSVVIVVTPARLGPELEALARFAHGQAVNGVPVSVMGLGARVDAAELGRLALAGQGNRRVLRGPASAEGAVDSELSSAARAIARAVRLRIRLAPGVQLVDVLGSRRLDAPDAQRVRDAEQSIDRRLARNLGITADRGDDEEGIQIVIPSFYAGDQHTVLLDVVVPGAGPVAEVSVRYKDLVHLGNGVARAHLSLDNRALARGPLQHAVLKNLLAHELSRTLGRAASRIAEQDGASARDELRAAHAVVRSARRALPALAGDGDLRGDGLLLERYDAALDAWGGDSRRAAFLSDSMRLSAALKLQPRAEWDPTGHDDEGRMR